MANSKIPQLPVLSAVTGDDLFYVVDVSDPTDDPTGSSKQITRDEILTNVNQIDFNLTAVTTNQEGRVRWDSDFGTLKVDLEGGDVSLKAGLDSLYYIKNQSGATIDKGRVVRAAGTLGSSGRILGEYMIGNGTVPHFYTLGIAGENILDGEDGYVYEFGLIREINTTGSLYGETWGNGTILYVHPTIAGGLTSVEPTEPNLKIQIAIVIDADSNGSLFVRPSLGYRLGDLHNIQTSGETDGDLISYNSLQGYWEYSKTLRGNYRVEGSLTADTISATTYENLPLDVRTTGGTYSSSTGTVTFSDNNGGGYEVSGFFKPSDDVYVTGGTYNDGVITFINKTGGTFNVTIPSNFSAGPISGSTGWSSAGSGQINLPGIKVSLYDNSNNYEPVNVYSVSSGTTGSGGIPSLTDNDTNYVVVEYNGGSPIYNVYDNDGVVNDSSVILVYIIYRAGNFIHVMEFGNYGAGLPNKLNDRLMMTNRFGWESGLSLGLSGSTGIVTATEGVAWNASYRQSLVAVNSQDDVFFKNYHSGGVWTYTTTGNTLNNTYYDNGTNIVEATVDKYLVNWYFRGQEVNDHLYEVYGNDEYDSVAEAELSVEPLLPELITSHAFLLGRIIVLKSETTGVTQSAFVRVFQSTQVDNHEDLLGLQGGGPSEYYHLTSSQYNNLPYKNSGNTFTQGQVFTSGVTANTLSISTTPITNDSPTEILSRNSTTGDVEVISAQSPGLFNYGLANAIMTGTFLT